MEELKTVVSEVLEARLKKKEAKADVQAADKEINTSNALSLIHISEPTRPY